MSDTKARLDALVAESMPVFEELADSCETVARSIRCVMLLMSANVDAEQIAPHTQTALAALRSIVALRPRLAAIVSKHRD